MQSSRPRRLYISNVGCSIEAIVIIYTIVKSKDNGCQLLRLGRLPSDGGCPIEGVVVVTVDSIVGSTDNGMQLLLHSKLNAHNRNLDSQAYCAIWLNAIHCSHCRLKIHQRI